MLKKIDAFVLSAHQWIVDTSGKRTNWWAEQSTIAFMLLEMMRFAFVSKSYMGLLGGLILGTAFYWLARIGHKERLDLVRPMSLMLTMIITTVGVLDHLFGQRPLLQVVVTFLSEIAVCSVFYFLSCDPPRPRFRRREAPNPT